MNGLDRWKKETPTNRATKKMLPRQIYFHRIYKDTNVGFMPNPSGSRRCLMTTFESSNNTLNLFAMAYTNNVNYSNFRSASTSKMNPRLKQLAILSLVTLLGMIVSIAVNIN
jgi:hypothetical protein